MTSHLLQNQTLTILPDAEPDPDNLYLLQNQALMTS